MYDYLVVGAGLFGAVFTHEMIKRGKSVLVVDKRDHIGGNIYTEKISGINVHRYGAHIFHTSDEQVWSYINQFAGFNNYVNSPVAVYKDEVYNLPFNMNTFNKMWGVKTPKEAMDKIAEQVKALGITEPKNLEEQALSLVGTDVYEKLIKGYTEKQWGRDCKELPAFIIKRLPLRFVYDNNYFNDKYQGIPVGGYTGIIEKLLSGAEVRLATDFLEHRELADEAKQVIYTGQIDQYYDYRLGVLKYRSVRFETEELDTNNFQGNAVVNYTEKEVPYTRIIDHKHFDKMGQPGGVTDVPQTIISREYSSEWKVGDEPYYPVNDEENNALYESYRALASSEEKVKFGGRLGAYKYYDMDKVIKEALSLVEEYE